MMLPLEAMLFVIPAMVTIPAFAHCYLAADPGSLMISVGIDPRYGLA